MALLLVAALGLGSALADGGPGSVLAWGENTWGQVGNSNAPTQANVPAAVSAGAIPAGTRIVQVAAGYDQSLAVSSTGQIYAWGHNNEGQLGDNLAETQANAPVAVSAGAIPAGTKIVQVAAGSGYSEALSSSGQVYSWGYNADGELGDSGAPTQANVPAAVSAGAMPAGTRIVQIAAGAGQTLALSSSGQVYAWGFNQEGQLGNNNAPNQANAPVAVSAGAIPAGTRVVQIAAGSAFSLALGSNGQVYAWGDNGDAELGDGVHELQANVPIAVSAGAMPAGTKIIQIAAGSDDALALSSTGQLYAWGLNNDGQLGDNEAESDAATPVAVSAGAIPAGTRIIQIAAGYDQDLALSSTGKVYAWGYNVEGQVGDNAQETQAKVPVAVSLPTGTTIDSLALGSGGRQELAVIGDLALATATLPAATVGLPYSASLAASGGVGAYAWSASGLPAGLSINAANGAIAGTPTAPANATVTVTVSDADGLTAGGSYTLTTSAFASASASVNRKTGAITFTQPLTEPGTLSWTLTFANGRDGVFAAAKHKPRCKVGEVRLAGRCRPSSVAFAGGSESVTAAGNASFTATPSRSASRALETALKHHRGLNVTATIEFQSALGGSPATATQVVSDKLAKAEKHKHKR